VKAVLKEDMIIHVTEKGDIEIGMLPPDVGLERLRWNGEKIVDLANLSEIWVRPLSPTFFELHAVKVPNSQKVSMSYQDRKRLVLERDAVRLLSSAKHEEKITAEASSVADNPSLYREAKNMVENLSSGKIDADIDNTFSDFNDQQRKILSDLYKAVLWLLKARLKK
jgi:hypothetical protein